VDRCAGRGGHARRLAAVITHFALARARRLDAISRGKALYDVSYSYLWVDALPGIEWSRTVREVLGYVVNRVRPGAEIVASRERAAETEAWAQQCQWIQLSQSQRILRWITSRPTRPVTMHAVRAALAQR
jgi:hypothetical protein